VTKTLARLATSGCVHHLAMQTISVRLRAEALDVWDDRLTQPWESVSLRS
jgi:hypothetical protein